MHGSSAMTHYRLPVGVIAVAAAALVHCTNEGGDLPDTVDRCRSSRQALKSTPLRGSGMPPKTIALTFDDGPGPRTKALSAYLKDQEIEAAFFVNGSAIGEGSDEILAQLVADGHIIGNHTETHRSLTGERTGTARPTDAEILRELAETDEKIAPYVPDGRFLFRPPYGDFDEKTFASLEDTPMNKYVGPVLWDVGDRMDEEKGEAADWDCWQDGSDGKRIPMTTCGDLYVTSIKRAGWGIVLLHDPYFNEDDPAQEGTVEMVMYMVPILKEEGFEFVRVDKIPEIAALLPPLTDEEGAPGTPEAPEAGDGGVPAALPDDDPCN